MTDMPTRPFRAEHLAALLVIALGGALGTLLRYGVSRWIHVANDGFPWATFWTNLTGSFLLGFLLIVLLERFPPTRYVRPFIATGILGAFTTMSTYTVETTLLIKDDHAATAVVYGLSSVAAGVFLAYAGIATARVTVGGMSRQ